MKFSASVWLLIRILPPIPSSGHFFHCFTHHTHPCHCPSLSPALVFIFPFPHLLWTCCLHTYVCFCHNLLHTLAYVWNTLLFPLISPVLPSSSFHLNLGPTPCTLYFISSPALLHVLPASVSSFTSLHFPFSFVLLPFLVLTLTLPPHTLASAALDCGTREEDVVEEEEWVESKSNSCDLLFYSAHCNSCDLWIF